MSLPAYTRARAIFPRLRQSMSEEELQHLCLYNAESHAILQALESQGDKVDLSSIKTFPGVVPDRGVSNRTMDAAIAVLNSMVRQKPAMKKKPWWKFWWPPSACVAI